MNFWVRALLCVIASFGLGRLKRATALPSNACRICLSNTVVWCELNNPRVVWEGYYLHCSLTNVMMPDAKNVGLCNMRTGQLGYSLGFGALWNPGKLVYKDFPIPGSAAHCQMIGWLFARRQTDSILLVLLADQSNFKWLFHMYTHVFFMFPLC